MIALRKTLGTAAVAAFAGLIVSLAPAAAGSASPGFSLVLWLGLLPLAATGLGLWLDRPWSRWLGLGIGLAVFPWAFVWVSNSHAYASSPTLTLAASLVLLASLSGSTMSAHFDAFGEALGRGRRRLLDWTIACNVAAGLTLALFVGAYDYDATGQQALTAGLLAGLVSGVIALGAGRTAGLLVVGACASLLVPAVTAFVITEATQPGEALLLAAAFLPGIATGLASVVAFGRPMWQVLRG